MSVLFPTRALYLATLTVGVFALSVCAQTPHRQPAPVARPATPSQGGFSRQHPGNPRANGEHLKEWMGQHGSLTPQQQQQALEHEPGFRDLPPQTQQRMREQLTRLNAMPPAQRQRILDRNEWMEHLTVEQRGQVRDATKQLANLPPDERRYVARTFRGLRELPPSQRENVLNSDRFSHLTAEQRSTLTNLMKVEPLLPPAYDGGPPAQPQQVQPQP